jgi:hypothetical protein
MCEMSFRTRAGPAGARAVESSVVVTAIHLQDADRGQGFIFPLCMAADRQELTL